MQLNWWVGEHGDGSHPEAVLEACRRSPAPLLDNSIGLSLGPSLLLQRASGLDWSASHHHHGLA